MPKPKSKFVLEFKDSDLLSEIAERFPSPQDEDDCPGDRWLEKFTEFGDYAEIELDFTKGTFRFLRMDK